MLLPHYGASLWWHPTSHYGATQNLPLDRVLGLAMVMREQCPLCSLQWTFWQVLLQYLSMASA